VHEDGTLHFDARLGEVADEAQALLPPDVRQAVQHIGTPNSNIM
jgi:hypothetical protein